jgi:hypothetical protein
MIFDFIQTSCGKGDSTGTSQTICHACDYATANGCPRLDGNGHFLYVSDAYALDGGGETSTCPSLITPTLLSSTWTKKSATPCPMGLSCVSTENLATFLASLSRTATIRATLPNSQHMELLLLSPAHLSLSAMSRIDWIPTSSVLAWESLAAKSAFGGTQFLLITALPAKQQVQRRMIAYLTKIAVPPTFAAKESDHQSKRQSGFFSLEKETVDRQSNAQSDVIF